jgi:hypothetical protein
MSSRIVLRLLGCLIFGHQRIIEVNERENKSEYVCERCRAVLGDFVTNLRKSWSKPVAGADSTGSPLGGSVPSRGVADVRHGHRAPEPRQSSTAIPCKREFAR